MKKKKAPAALAAALEERGYDPAFASAVARFLNTEYTAGRMLRYLAAVTRPLSPEEIADEMLAVLEGRDAYVAKKIAEKNKKPAEELYLRGFEISWDAGAGLAERIPALRGIEEWSFERNITFITGENGSGKSTLLEGLAIALGLNPEGGTRNFRFSTYDDYSDLYQALRLDRGGYMPRQSYFLRAESFYNMATAALTEYNYDGRMPDYHSRSHGESFLEYICKYDMPGLYLLDEPEAALSPQRQLSLLRHLVMTARAGAQYLIVTHSPILLAAPDADILSLDGGVMEHIPYEETESYQVYRSFLLRRETVLRELFAEGGEEEEEE